MASKRIVITGASGNVGTALLRRLQVADDTYEVVGLARRRPPQIGVYASATWHQIDIAEPDAAPRLENLFAGADCVVHLAWGFQPTRNTSYLNAVAVGGSSAVLQAAHKASVGQLIHMSSVGTYAAGRYGRRVDESWSTAGIPTSAYSRGKSAVESMLDRYENRHNRGGVPIARMRPGLIIQHDAAAGIRRYMLPAYVPPRWLRFLPLLPLDRSLVASFVHADDVADAIVKAVERHAYGPFNLAAEPPVRRDDIARLLGAKPVHVPSALLRAVVSATWLVRVQPVDRGWLDLAFSVPLLDTGRARTELGWAPRHDALDALSDLGRGFLQGGETDSPVLQDRSLTESLRRDMAAGPLTTRHVP